VKKKEVAISDAVCYTDDAANESGCLRPAYAGRKGNEMSRQPKPQEITALYERLSRDDELQGPSNSIKNQQTMLEEYAKNHGFTNIVHFTDDGISGTRWDRPGFVKMMDETEVGNVSVVLCKDTSRLGRDYLRVGLFMETLRQKGVRLIAIGDNVDTANGEDDFMPFRNIFAEWHARDTSRKIKVIYKSKGMNGKNTSSHPLYGLSNAPRRQTKANGS
jgi:DNA invertase Pin-like site-specific DNA recombinase